MWVYVVIGVGAVLVLLVCFMLAIANFSFDNFREKRDEAMRYSCSQNLTIYDFVEEVNETKLKTKLQVERCEEYQDHFSIGTISLSESTLRSNGLASFATVGHELGHAVQYEKGELTKHWQQRRKNRILGRFFLPLILIGVVLAVLGLFSVLPFYVVYIGIAFAGVSFLIFLIAIYTKFMEVKIEKGASTYAIMLLRDYLNDAELKICKEFLDSARLTYWGSLFRTMLGWTFLTKKERMFI